MLLAALFACTDTVPTPADPAATGDSGTPDDSGDTGETPPDAGDGLYDPTVIHTIALSLPADSRTSLTTDPTTYAPADVEIDGEAFEEVGVRIKGAATMRPLTGKPSLKIDLDHYVDQDLDGVKMVQLHNLVMDASQLHERVAWAAVEAAGLPAARVSFARVTLDGEDYGLYSVVEPFNGGWLERNFPDADGGNLYEGGYHNFSDGTSVLADFTSEGASNFDLEEGEDVEFADTLAVAEVAEDTTSADWYADLKTVVDTDTLLRTMALEVWLAQGDGYLGWSNNFRVYFHPDTGLAHLWMQGLDLTFADFSWYGVSSPSGVLAARCLADDACWDDFLAAVEDVAADVDAADLETIHADTWALIEPEVETDPKRTFSIAYVDNAQDEVENWLKTRTGGLVEALEQNRPDGSLTP